MHFEWHQAKNAANIAKHGIDFEDAIRIFDGPVLENTDTRRDYGERRIIAFGVLDGRQVVVIYTMRRGCRRIISARRHIEVNAKRIVKRTPKANRRRGKTNWAQVDAMSDGEIAAAIKSDPDAAPLLDGNWFKRATVVMPERKVPISLRIDREVVEWFKAHGSRYQSRMNAVLKAYVQAHRRAE